MKLCQRCGGKVSKERWICDKCAHQLIDAYGPGGLLGYLVDDIFIKKVGRPMENNPFFKEAENG